MKDPRISHGSHCMCSRCYAYLRHLGFVSPSQEKGMERFKAQYVEEVKTLRMTMTASLFFIGLLALALGFR